MYRSPVIVFFDRGHPLFRNFNSAICVDVIRVKSYVIASLTLPVKVSGVFGNGGGLGTGKSYIPVVLFNRLLHRSSCLTDVDFATLAGSPVDYTILFSRIDGVLWSHQA